MEPDDDFAKALDWRGRVIRCRECDHFAMNGAGLCAKGKACIRDRRARRVDRFLRDHRELADSYLDHPYFEVRACAAQYASTFRLPPLPDDPEPEVRAVATMRLPAGRVRKMAFDADICITGVPLTDEDGLDIPDPDAHPEVLITPD